MSELKASLVHPVVTIGNFDGVHLGHQEIISQAVKMARERQGTAVGFTFRPHPQLALNPSAKLQLLSTYDEKLELLAEAGLDLIVEEPFSREFSSGTAESFFNHVILRHLSAEAVVVGYDFAFGKGREGQLDSLSKLCKDAGVNLTIVQAQKLDGEVVSSSRVRQHLLSGNVAGACRLLGREFSYRGVVIKGDGRGRQLGFPTANLKLEDKLALPNGVYATWAMFNGVRYPSVTNVGVRPTFQKQGDREFPAIVETHLIDVTLDLYGSTLDVRFVGQIRDERRFAGIEELKSQIALDLNQARKTLQAISSNH